MISSMHLFPTTSGLSKTFLRFYVFLLILESRTKMHKILDSTVMFKHQDTHFYVKKLSGIVLVLATEFQGCFDLPRYLDFHPLKPVAFSQYRLCKTVRLFMRLLYLVHHCQVALSFEFCCTVISRSDFASFKPPSWRTVEMLCNYL